MKPEVFDKIVFSAIVLIAVTVLSVIMHNSLQTLWEDYPWGVWGIIVAAALGLVLIAVHFIFTFTRDLSINGTDNANSGNESLSPQLRTVFIYGYVFMLVALSLCATPFFVPMDKVDSSFTARLPAGIVVGCRSDYCNDTEDQELQWFLHIGSSISIPKAAPSDAETNGNSRKAVRTASYVVLTGGLAVPLYVVFLALMGGAVSMTRRLPEYQKRATRLYKEEWDSETGRSTGEEPPIKAVRARELIIFQIMQVFTAPLIAFTAFAVFGPDTVASGALLGFLSGFTSEMILLRLRTAAKALSGREK